MALVGFLFLMGHRGTSQQYPLSLTRFIHPYRLNIATGGIDGKVTVSGIYRDQWSGLPGHPRGSSISISAPMNEWSGAWGAQLEDQRIGLEHHIGSLVSYSQVFPMNQILIAGGLGLSYQYINVDYNSIRTPDGNYQGTIIDHNDPHLDLARLTGQNINVHPAIYFQTHWFESGIELEWPLIYFSKEKTQFYTKNKNLKFLINKEYKVGKYELYSHLVVNSDFVQIQSEILLKIQVNGNIFGSILWRGFNENTLDGVGGMVGFRLNSKIWLVYGVELPLNKIKNQISGLNQEMGLRVQWNRSMSRYKIPLIYHPRWSD